MKSVVVFYSLDGGTRKAAEKIAERLQADIVELHPEKRIPSKGFFKYMIGGMQVKSGKKPALKPYNFQKEAYDLVILGTPIWASGCTPAMNTFLSENDISDRKIAVLTSSAGGDGAQCLETMKKMLPHLVASVCLMDERRSEPAENDRKLESFLKILSQ